MEDRKRESFFANLIYRIGVAISMGFILFILANIGQILYGEMVVQKAEGNKLRTSLSCVSEQIRQSDEEDNIYIERRQNKDVLMINKQEIAIDEKELKEAKSIRMEMKSRYLLQITATDKRGKEESITIYIRTRR